MILTPETEARVYAAMKPELPLKIVCCWCVPHHVIRLGAEPVSHGACPLGVAAFERGGRS